MECVCVWPFWVRYNCHVAFSDFSGLILFCLINLNRTNFVRSSMQIEDQIVTVSDWRLVSTTTKDIKKKKKEKKS